MPRKNDICFEDSESRQQYENNQVLCPRPSPATVTIATFSQSIQYLYYTVSENKTYNLIFKDCIPKNWMLGWGVTCPFSIFMFLLSTWMDQKYNPALFAKLALHMIDLYVRVKYDIASWDNETCLWHYTDTCALCGVCFNLVLDKYMHTHWDEADLPKVLGITLEDMQYKRQQMQQYISYSEDFCMIQNQQVKNQFIFPLLGTIRHTKVMHHLEYVMLTDSMGNEAMVRVAYYLQHGTMARSKQQLKQFLSTYI